MFKLTSIPLLNYKSSHQPYRSIGIFAHSANPIELNMTLHDTVTLLNLDDPDKIEFFTTIATSTLPTKIKGFTE